MNVPNRYNWGDATNNENPQLYKQLNDIYTRLANAVNAAPKRTIRGTAPSNSSNDNRPLNVGDIWVNEAANTAYIMTSRTTAENVNWLAI